MATYTIDVNEDELNMILKRRAAQVSDAADKGSSDLANKVADLNAVATMIAEAATASKQG